MRSPLLAGAAVFLLSAGGARAAWDDWSLQPLTGELGDLNYSVGGQLQGSVFTANQPGTFSTTGGTGAAQLNARIERDYDSGLAIALKGQFELFHDRLSSDNYGGDLVAKTYVSVQTGLGRIDVGMSDGAAYALAIVGPAVNGEVSIDNPNATFFRDPSTGGRAFIDLFALNSAVESSLNYDKISYYSPRLFGFQIAASFTPSEAKIVVPFANNGPNVANRQRYLWEGAANYSDSFGPITLGVYGGVTVGHNDTKTPGHAGLTDWAFGSEADWNIDDDTKWSIGGAYRQANTYAFDINNALASGATQSMHLSSVLSYGSWSIGGEFGNGAADGAFGLPTLGMHAYMVDAAYAVNSNLQISGGWQRLNYHSTATFYNGLPRIEMDAFFLHAALNI
ncbi:MAG TPA: hypothetical protein VMU08_05435 [Rhizomicrobium sp.]|nr:hypothetical protein [Rhizomicrobium sp.]